jgi:hypothetical protein
LKFIYADAQDYVDPNYNFQEDRHAPDREPYWDDMFPHEILKHAPYDGILVSRAIVGTPSATGKYSQAQAMRLSRVGAREFLRFNSAENKNKPLFGDNGAFSYSNQKTPPYSASDTVEFYADGRFTHGCSVDHIIFEFDKGCTGLSGGSEISRERYDITLQLASEFYKESKKIGKHFTPLGVIQGWSPDSMALAAKNLINMGYRYLAIGGLVPLKAPQIHEVLIKINNEITKWPSTKLHLLGFAKLDHLHEFVQYKKIASFDSTSPLLRAFKDSTKNYYFKRNSKLEYFTAIRIPQATENLQLVRHAKTGRYRQEDLLQLEKTALDSLRQYSLGKRALGSTLKNILAYAEPLITTDKSTEEMTTNAIKSLEIKYRRTLEQKPWDLCKCDICRSAGVEVLIFRASNRNKRRGIHNLRIFHEHLKHLRKK